jgi:protein involved in ribonucleotide reduction
MSWIGHKFVKEIQDQCVQTCNLKDTKFDSTNMEQPFVLMVRTTLYSVYY